MILFSIGFLSALVVIQFFPKAAGIGAYIVKKSKEAFSEIFKG